MSSLPDFSRCPVSFWAPNPNFASCSGFSQAVAQRVGAGELGVGHKHC